MARSLRYLRAFTWNPPPPEGLMRYLTSPALVLLLVATIITAAAPNPMGLLGRLSAQDFHVYEVQLQGESPFELRADRIVQHPSGMVTLEDDGVTVAAFVAYQLIYVVRTGTKAERTYELKIQDGSVRQFGADRISSDPSNLIRLEAGGELVGIVWNNNVRYVVAVDARP
jgi:hypothetical protein